MGGERCSLSGASDTSPWLLRPHTQLVKSLFTSANVVLPSCIPLVGCVRGAAVGGVNPRETTIASLRGCHQPIAGVDKLDVRFAAIAAVGSYGPHSRS